MQAIRERQPVQGQVMGVTRLDGRVLWLDANAIPVFDDEGALGEVVTTFIDITERKNAEEEQQALLDQLTEINEKLERSNRELQDFAYVASHDLREPLRKISSFASLLQDSLEGRLDEDERENFGFMIDGAERMNHLIDDLLSYSRITTRARPPEPVDLNVVLEELEGFELSTLLEETGGFVVLPEQLLPVQGDPSQVRQLLQNLVGNALKFHRDGVAPVVTIRARSEAKGMVRVEVEDNGMGIPAEYYEQIFVMFKRLHSREQYGGTGIGLAICKKIVERHGGEMGLRSSPGEGTTFWFALPPVLGEPGVEKEEGREND